MKKLKRYKTIVDNKIKYFGETDTTKRIIRVNKSKKKNRRGDVLNTIVHEEMHAHNPKMSEKQVVSKTKQKIARMLKKQKNRYYQLFE